MGEVRAAPAAAAGPLTPPVLVGVLVLAVGVILLPLALYRRRRPARVPVRGPRVGRGRAAPRYPERTPRR